MFCFSWSGDNRDLPVLTHTVPTRRSSDFRVGACRLFALSLVLDVPFGFFFGEMPAAVAASSPAQLPGSAQPLPEQELDPRVKRETLELVRAYYKIGESGVRKRLFEMTKALAAASSGTAQKPED